MGAGGMVLGVAHIFPFGDGGEVDFDFGLGEDVG